MDVIRGGDESVATDMVAAKKDSRCGEVPSSCGRTRQACALPRWRKYRADHRARGAFAKPQLVARNAIRPTGAIRRFARNLYGGASRSWRTGVPLQVRPTTGARIRGRGGSVPSTPVPINPCSSSRPTARIPDARKRAAGAGSEIIQAGRDAGAEPTSVARLPPGRPPHIPNTPCIPPSRCSPAYPRSMAGQAFAHLPQSMHSHASLRYAQRAG